MTSEEMYSENQKLVYKAMSVYFPTYAGDEDYLQIARMGLWKACQKYKSDKGVCFSTFAIICIRNEVFMELRRGMAKQRRPKAIPHIPFFDPDFAGAEDDYSDVEITEFALLLPERERMVLDYLLSVKAPKYSESLEISRAEYKEALENIREAYREYFADD